MANQRQMIGKMIGVLQRSPNPANIFTCSPGICALPNGRLIATMDMCGDGVKQMEGIKGVVGERYCQGSIFLSDDGGNSWRFIINTPMMHARPFTAGNSVYVLGHAGDLTVVRSDDGGETWTEAVKLTDGERWHQAPCNVHYCNGHVYLVMERNLEPEGKLWPVATLAPVLMRGKCGDDLTKKENWTFASEICYRDTVDVEKCGYFGVPFYRHLEIVNNRVFCPVGWLESNVVQFTDPRHIWFDESGHTFHIFMRAHTGTTNIAAILKVVENEDGSMTTMLENAPSGQPILYVPFPGGEMKFHILKDEKTDLFWLVATQPTDSMIKGEAMTADRYNIPNDERQRLVLYFSRNCVDWCFAGMVDKGATQKQSRHYASMVIHGDDLIILSRSGDENADSAHNTNMITVHKVENFRELIY